ncbi:MAG: phosphate/phosphite/phosphonate ABC transporter substrate-binding protein [Firmicutes bacterium]|nr:phosphate/phosphite/phosphonate ABC transporter substrate-binding protein [Bacillota bacterium]
MRYGCGKPGARLAAIFCAWALAVTVATAGGASAQEVLRVGVVPALTQGQTRIGIEKLQDHLASELGRTVEIQVLSDYAAVVEALGFGHVDMAYLGPRTYVIAHHRYGAQAVVTQLIDGSPYYHSYFIVPHDSPLQSIDELRGKQVAFGDPSSTSGSLIPKLELIRRGIDPDRDLRALHTGSHDATALAVLNRHVDAGAIDSAYFHLLIRRGQIPEDGFRVIWQSEPLFQYPWAVRKNMDPELIEQIRAAFLKITDQDILDAFGASGFTIATNEDYELIRQAAEAFGDLQ